MKIDFKKALPIYAKEMEGVLNSSLFFRLSLNGNETRIRLSAHNFYRIYLDGNFFAYGPSRGAHDHYRIDEYDLPARSKTLVIEVSGSHCYSFYALNRPAFLCFETYDALGEVVQYSSLDTVIHHNETRIQKLTRFSFQRAFAESYRLDPSFMEYLKDAGEPFARLTPVIVDVPNFEKRIVDYPSYPRVKFECVECGSAFYDETRTAYEDRYQTSTFLKIYPREEWEMDPNDFASKVNFVLEPFNGSAELEGSRFLTYRLNDVYTGFFDLFVEVHSPSTLYLLFDEIDIRDEKNPDLIGISFSRNTTHNCVTYELKPGSYRLTTFEPYAAKYLRIVCPEGSVHLQDVSLIRYENPGISDFHYSFANQKIENVFFAATNTFAQNAVDLLTDCPSRERAGWLCDSFYSGQAEPFIAGNNKNEEAFLDNYAVCSKDYLPEGMIPPCYPADFPSREFIPNWALWYILELDSYRLRHGDSPMIEKSLENVRGILSYFERFENSHELLENLEGWIFVEWSKANDADYVSGVNAPSNMLYASALEKASGLLKDPSLKEKAKRIKSFLRSFFYNGKFFVDNALRDEEGELVLTDHTTETCQYYAFYFDVASPSTYPDLFNTMREYFGQYRDDKTTFPTVYKSNVLMGILMRLSVLNRYGYAKQVYEESVEYFAKMAEITGTLWENDSPCASLDHCFTSYIVCLLLEANFGLLYVDEERKEIHVRHRALGDEGQVSFLLEGGCMKARAKDGEIAFEIPSSYRLVYED